jgi:hypothetical protein
MYQDIEKDVAAGALGAAAITAGACALPLGAVAIATSCVIGGAVAHTVSAISRWASSSTTPSTTYAQYLSDKKSEMYIAACRARREARNNRDKLITEMLYHVLKYSKLGINEARIAAASAFFQLEHLDDILVLKRKLEKVIQQYNQNDELFVNRQFAIFELQEGIEKYFTSHNAVSLPLAQYD